MPGKRILVIEDHEENRRLLRDLLTSFGYELIEAVTGEEGLVVAKAEGPDLILMDIQLPGIDGYEIARRVRSTLPGRTIRLIAVTGYGRAEDRAAVMKAGFDAHVVKPMNPDELVRLLRE